MRWFTLTVRAVMWAAILIGLPLLLTRYGSPLPDHVPTGDDWRVLVTAPDERTLADGIIIAAWLGWVVIVVSLISRIVRASRSDDPATPATQRWNVPGPVRAISAVLLGGTAATATAAVFTTPAHAAPAPVVPDHDIEQQQPAATVATVPTDEPPTESENDTYTVKTGDTLWDIADCELGDPWRWRDIWNLNKHTEQTTGERFSDPDLIRPGWILTMPTTTDGEQDEPETEPPAPPPDPDDGEDTNATPTPTPSTTDTPSTTPGIPETSTPASQPAPTSATPEASATATSASASEAPVTPSDSRPSTTPGSSPFVEAEGGGLRLPSGAWISAGLATAVAAAVVVARKRHRRSIAAGRFSTPIRTRRGVRGVIDAAAETTDPAPADDVQVAALDVLPAVLALDGSGADAAVRHFIAEHLTAGHTVLTTPDVLDRLTAGRDVTDPPGLVTTDPLGPKLQQRLLAAVRDNDTGNNAAPSLLAVTGDPSDAAGIDTVAENVDAHIIVLTDDPPAAIAAWNLDGDGHSTPDSTPPHRWHHLGPDEFTGILGTLTDTAPTPTTKPDDQPEPEADDEADDDAGHRESPAAAVDAAEDPADTPPATAAAVELTLFGPVTITAAGTRVTTGLRSKTRELIAYLAENHPRGSHKDALTEAVLPDITMSKAPGHLKTLISNARTVLRRATGQPDTEFITYTNDTYRLDPATLTCDLWRMRTHLRDARIADTPTEEATHLHNALTEYTGTYADDLHADWTEPAREHHRRTAVTAATRLAQHHTTTGDTEAALAAWQSACHIAPLDEPLHQQAITACLHAQHPTLAKKLYRELKIALAEIDAAPEADTRRLMDDMGG